jgi:predicted DNA-binding protein with PD1-like motif
MKYDQGSIGRVFVLRLEDGDVVNDTIEAFARDHDISHAVAFYVGGTAGGSRLVVGPDATRDDAMVPLVYTLTGARETFAFGTLAPDENRMPSLHMHAAAGREGDATVGCTRAGLETWLIGEVVLIEITGSRALRRRDPATGFQLLDTE